MLAYIVSLFLRMGKAFLSGLSPPWYPRISSLSLWRNS